MEHVPDGTLIQWSEALRGIEHIALENRLRVFVHIAQAVSAAHELGIIHKDIKPTNILMEGASADRSVPKLIDFGIGFVDDRSRLDGAEITSLGFTETVVIPNDSSRTGTRMYTPPEVVAGDAHTTKGDVYALGVLLYQMVIGDFARALGSGWERDVTDDLLRSDIAEAVDGEPDRRLQSAEVLFRRVEKLPQRKEEDHRRRKRQRQQAFMRRMLPVSLIAIALMAFMVTVLMTNNLREKGQRVLAEASEDRQRVETTIARKREENAYRHLHIANLTLLQNQWQNMELGDAYELLKASGTYTNRGFAWAYWNEQLNRSHWTTLKTPKMDTQDLPLYEPIAAGFVGSNQVVVTYKKGLAFWNDRRATNPVITHFQFHQPCTHAVISPKGDYVVLRHLARKPPTEAEQISLDGRWDFHNLPLNTVLSIWDCETRMNTTNIVAELSQSEKGEQLLMSPDGSLVATTFLDARNEKLTVRTREVATGKKLGEFSFTPKPVYGVEPVTFLPEDDGFLVRVEGGVELYTLLGEKKNEAFGDVQPRDRVIFSPNGKIYAKLQGKSLGMIKYPEQTTNSQLTADRSFFLSDVALSKSGDYVAVGRGVRNNLRIWRPAGEGGPAMIPFPGWIESIRFSPDDNYLIAVFRDGQIKTAPKLSALRNGRYLHSQILFGLIRHDSSDSLVIAMKGTYRDSTNSPTVRIVDRQTLKRTATFSFPREFVSRYGPTRPTGIRTAPGANRILVFRERFVSTFELLTINTNGWVVDSMLIPHRTRVEVAPDGAVTNTPKKLIIRDAAYVTSNRLAVITEKPNLGIQYWNADSKEMIRYDHRGSTNLILGNPPPVDFSRDGRRLAWVFDRTLRLEELDANGFFTPVVSKNLPGYGYVSEIGVSESGRLTALAKSENIEIWTSSSQELRLLHRIEIDAPFKSVQFSDDDRYLLVSRTSELSLWDVVTGKRELVVPCRSPGMKDPYLDVENDRLFSHSGSILNILRGKRE